MNYADISHRIVKQDIEYLVAGMELARDIVSLEGKVLASQGTLISQYTIDQLKKRDIKEIYIYVEVPVESIIDPIAQQFIAHYTQSVDMVKKSFQHVIATNEVPLDNFAATAEEITGNITTTGNGVDLLYSLFQSNDDAIYRHSVNVSIISALIATWLKLPAEIVSAISLTGLLHDIGKTQLPPELFKMTGELSEEEILEYNKHTLFGFELVRKLPDVSQSIAQGVLQHHEFMDGSGYPYGSKKEKIHPYAQIIAIADLYDKSLIINNNEGIVLSPYTGLEILWKEAYRLNTNNCIVFRDNMLNFLSGNMVVLSDGRKGRVILVSKETPSRSTVQLEDGSVINLFSEKDLHIHHVLR